MFLKIAADAYGDSDDEVIADPAFLESVLQTLPGVDPQSEAVQQAMSELTQQKNSDEKKDEKKDGNSSKQDS